MSNGIVQKKALSDMDFNGKTAIVRVDFNVPLDNGSQVRDDTRITAALPTLRYLREHKAKIVLMSHLGRPKGKKDLKYSLKPVARHLKGLWPQEVYFSSDCIGEEPKKLAKALKPGEILLLENARFYPEEENNDREFAQKLAEIADIYVNDAFGTAHRSHASTEGIAHILPSCAGFLLESEIKSLCEAINEPARPFVAIIGGAKTADKIAVIENLLNKVDKLLIGGGMAHTFSAAKGFNTENSLVDREKIPWAKEILALESASKLVLPVDIHVAQSFSEDSPSKIVRPGEIPPGWEALDIGPATIKLFTKELVAAATIVWNGPLGVFEMPKFAVGTIEIAKAAANSPGFTIIGGGDSVAAVHKAGVTDKIDHISTGGGASLKVLEGKVLPGLAALEDK